MAERFDAVVIGAGQAGGPLAHQLADRGWKVALIEREFLGGSCINYGCTPTKKMIASARVAHLARRAGEYGVQTGPVGIDFQQIVRMKDELVQSWRQGQQDQIDKRPTLRLVRGEAAFTGPHTLQVNGETFESERIFLNTGANPRLLPIPGLAGLPVLTNRNIMDLTEVPDHLVVIGGSYIGLEFGQMFHRFGSQVTVLENSPQLVAREDEDIARPLQEALEAEGMTIHLSVDLKQAFRTAQGGVCLSFETPNGGELQTVEGSHLLVAVGQQPNTQALNLDAAGIETEPGGWIRVNEYLETNVPGVWALGDVKGGPAFTHISYNDYLIVLHNLFEPEKRSTRDRVVPYALYTDPELGRVGLTERQARQEGRAIKVGKVPFSRVARAIERNETQGWMKVIVDADSGQILGAAILGVEGGELVQTLLALMLAKAPWTTVQRAQWIHPTLTEGFYSLFEALA